MSSIHINTSEELPCSSSCSINLAETESDNTSTDAPDLIKARIDGFQIDVLEFVYEIYNNSLVPRKFVIYNVERILCKGVISVFNKMSALQETDSNITFFEQLFSSTENLFAGVNTEYKCVKLYKESGLNIPCKTVQIGERLQKKYTASMEVILEPHSVCIKVISLADLFSTFLSTGKLLHCMKDYYQQLQQETTIISNFVQCQLWKSKVGNSDATIFPLFLYFDDYQIGNPLGPSASKNKIGAVYVSLPCLPPHITSKLSNIFLCSLFYSSDRKEQNQVLIENEKVYCKVGLISGDNLGMYSILGFTESTHVDFAKQI